MLNRQSSLDNNDDQKSTSEQRPRRTNVSANPWVRMSDNINIF